MTCPCRYCPEWPAHAAISLKQGVTSSGIGPGDLSFANDKLVISIFKFYFSNIPHCEQNPVYWKKAFLFIQNRPPWPNEDYGGELLHGEHFSDDLPLLPFAWPFILLPGPASCILTSTQFCKLGIVPMYRTNKQKTIEELLAKGLKWTLKQLLQAKTSVIISVSG